MSTTKEETNSVIAEFQAVVEELQSRGLSTVEIHSLVNMIDQKWLVAGQPTKEYLELAAKALELRNQPQTRTVLTDVDGRPLVG